MGRGEKWKAKRDPSPTQCKHVLEAKSQRANPTGTAWPGRGHPRQIPLGLWTLRPGSDLGWTSNGPWSLGKLLSLSEPVSSQTPCGGNNVTPSGPVIRIKYNCVQKIWAQRLALGLLEHLWI